MSLYRVYSIGDTVYLIIEVIESMNEDGYTTGKCLWYPMMPDKHDIGKVIYQCLPEHGPNACLGYTITHYSNSTDLLLKYPEVMFQ